MEVFLANEQGLHVDETRLSSLASHVLDSEEADEDVELSILLVTGEHMKELNTRFAGEKHATDVLAFPMEEDEDATLLGDVVICPEVAQRNARRLGHALRDELDVLLVHGTLHLLGYDHQGREDRTEMERRLKEVLVTFKPVQL
ncbi:MAG: rRNA maturation RNase YbeY [Actinomycetota bacterium]|nr:rRNA maturation RNase YbeY [Actinomycetota bacterium]